jgi:hypothetical protein
MLRQILPILLFTAVFFNTHAQNTSPYWSLAGNSGSTATASSKLGTTTSVPLNLTTNNLTRLRITQTGRVGINTNDPATLFQVNGFGSFGNRVTTGNAARALNLADTAAVMRILRVHATNAPAVELISRTTADGSNVAYWDMYAQPSDKSFRIRDRQTGANLDRLTINRDGFVGIGTTSPDLPLVVEGRIRLRSSSGGTAGLWLNNLANTNAIGFVGAANDNQIGLWGNPNLGWGLLMNTTTGNIGIGTQTPLNRLTVSERTTSYATVTIENLWPNAGGSSADGMYIRAGTDVGTGGSYYIGFTRPDAGFIGAISQNGPSSVSYQTVSDKRLKANIRETKFGLADVNRIEVRDYNYIGQNAEQTGFLAQQLYEVFPEAVSVGGEDPKTRPWMVDYGRITPLLVKGMQELSKENKVLKEENKTIKGELTELRQMVMELKNGRSSTANFSSAFLEQASPNPAKNTTLIRYSAPDGTSSAKLILTNAKGQVVKEINLANTGTGQVNLNTTSLPSGTYNYSLWINGQQAASKQLVIMK